MRKVCCVILEYCGGAQTDKLHKKLSAWNPSHTIYVLDNASPHNTCSCITHRNEHNSGIGGGIRDALQLARTTGADVLLLIVNDVVPVTKIDIGYYEELLNRFPDVVQVSASITRNTAQAANYPWMIDAGSRENRVVPHADLLCCAIDIDFVENFGGFPPSRGGWGYDWEIAYHADLLKKKIVVCDFFKVKHIHPDTPKTGPQHEDKYEELVRIYDAKYGSYRTIFVHEHIGDNT
ncbi:hypothetical protein HF329_13050 [Chitinophaga oryzae]|uniref:Uncharacterized protein n=1 Tax=Chitinophaga oryzae TaxID=2725414 RepID=A0AAE6ZG61_9BACT|nr:hypothetical protein [Chitinophaga oryzae]QJB32203.1 hypothetical protein HF329_13050 [Chitinophaga oryzae]